MATLAKKQAQEALKRYGPGLKGLLKQGWNEVPELLASGGMALCSVGIAAYVLLKYKRNDGDNRDYKSHYIIMRPDDPRADRVRRLAERNAKST